MSAPTDKPSAESPTEPTTPEDQPTETAPLLRVVNADATPEEIAALVAVFAALGAGEAEAPRRTSEWEAHHRKLRPSPPPGLGWRASALPQ